MNVIIIGKAMGWKQAPADGETWGVNDTCLRRPIKLAFNMHNLEKHKDHPLFNKTIAHINENKIPVITQKKYPHIPTSIPFPLDEMPKKYFGNSIDYMVAYAIYKKATSMDLYGVAMLLDTEYALQRPSLEYWIGRAEGSGISVNIHGQSSIGSNPKGLYGYDWDDEAEDFVKSRKENRT